MEVIGIGILFMIGVYLAPIIIVGALGILVGIVNIFTGK